MIITRIISVLLIILLIIVGVMFAALNATHVEINYLIGHADLPLALILLISLLIGVLLSVLCLGFGMLKLKAHNKWLESKIKN